MLILGTFFKKTSFFVIFLTFLVSAYSFAGAQELRLVASVNIQDTNIIDRSENTFTIAFDLANGEGLQSGVHYGVTLYNSDNTQIVDKKVYEESLTLLEHSTTHREITYTAPAGLNGKYNIFITSSNENNFPFGIAFVKEVDLVNNNGNITIDPASCVVGAKKTPLKEGFIADANQKSVDLSCTVSNRGVDTLSIAPVIESRSGGVYGGVVAREMVNQIPTSLKPMETKTITVTVPLVTTPGLYDAKIVFSTPNGESNPFFLTYLIPGMVTTIRNATPDKDVYKKGDTAVVGVIWSVDQSNVERVTLDTVIKSTGGWECAAPDTQQFRIGYLREPVTTISFPITKQCINPTIFVSIKDDAGNVLGSKEFKVDTLSAPLVNKKTTLAIIIVVILAAIMSLYITMRARRHPTQGTLPSDGFPPRTFVLFIVGFLVSSLLVTHQAHAFTYTNGVVTTTGSMTTTFPAGTSSSTATVQISSTAQKTVSLTASNNGATPRTTLLSNGTVSPGNPLGPFIYPFNIPPTPGTYAVNFETGVDDAMVYVKVEVLDSNGWTTGPNYCDSGWNNPPGYVDFWHTSSTERASFFSDPAGTVPLNVSGLGFQLNMSGFQTLCSGNYCYCSGPGTPSGVAVSSGTYYDYPGSGTDEEFTQQYGPSSCDTQTICAYGFSVHNGLSMPVPYSILPPPPTASIAASPANVYTGGSSTISWSSTYATSCTGSGFSTGGDVSGAVTVTINGDTTYSVTCTNSVGSDAQSITVYDLGTPPPMEQCYVYPGYLQDCYDPQKCQEDVMNSGYQVCGF